MQLREWKAVAPPPPPPLGTTAGPIAVASLAAAGRARLCDCGPST